MASGGSPPPTCKRGDKKKDWSESPGGDGGTGAANLALPHIIVQKMMSRTQELVIKELQWKAHVQNLLEKGFFTRALGVVHVGNSMPANRKHVGISISLLIAALTKPPFHGLLCSFSDSPLLHEVNQPNLRGKVEIARCMDSGPDINMKAVFKLILEKALSAKLPSQEMLETVYVFSDMDFGECGGQQYKTDYMLIKREFEEAGYPLPGIVAWNVRGDPKPPTHFQNNVILVNGFNSPMMETFLQQGKV